MKTVHCTRSLQTLPAGSEKTVGPGRQLPYLGKFSEVRPTTQLSFEPIYLQPNTACCYSKLNENFGLAEKLDHVRGLLSGLTTCLRMLKMVLPNWLIQPRNSLTWFPILGQQRMVKTSFPNHTLRSSIRNLKSHVQGNAAYPDVIN